MKQYLNIRVMCRHYRLFLPLALLLGTVLAGHGQTSRLERSAPEAQGIPSGKVIDFFDSIMNLKTTEIHSALLMRHGKVIGEIYPRPFAAEYGHALFSCSKTFTAAAVGMAVAENRLSTGDRLAVFFPGLLPDSIPGELAAVTVRHLLTMTSGFHPTDRIRNTEREWVKHCLANGIVSAPGTRFAYDSMNTYLLSAIIQRVTGQTLLDYLKPRLFEPLCITEAKWEYSPEGITCGGWGLHLQTESLAKFGQLLLNKGAWHGRQLIPETWVEEMMRPQVYREDGAGYGYQMWTCSHPDAARADGAYSQYIIVMPGEDMVAVITQCAQGDAGSKEQQLLYGRLLPCAVGHPLPASSDYGRLQRKARAYSLPFAEGSRRNAGTNAAYGREYALEGNVFGWRAISVAQGKDGLSVRLKTGESGSVSVVCGYKEWLSSPVECRFVPHPRGATLGTFNGFDRPFTVSSCYAWKGKDELEARMHFVDWMSSLKINIRFSQGQARLTVLTNYDSKPVTVCGTQENTASQAVETK